MQKLSVAVVCEESGTVRDAFIALGHDAISCDILPTRRPGPHYQGDAREFLQNRYFDLVIAHPPCTYLSNSGVRWLYNADKARNETRWELMREAAEFFRWFLDLPVDKFPRLAVENPIQHGHAKKIIGIEYTQIIQPYQFGHGETKATCLWLRGLPELRETNRVNGREQRIWKLPPGPNRRRERSETYQGIADAMAMQWGGYVE